ncbi:MAG: hypothetical protein ACON5F_11615 [Jejuia sp.]
MKTVITYIIGCTLIAITALSCSGRDGGDDMTDPDPGQVNAPSAASLVFPEQNSECTTGSNLSSTESTIVFDWNDADNTTSYQLFVKNLETQNMQNYTSNVSERSVTISRGTPYSWYVVSRNSGNETAQSTTWKFYNAGEATSSYAPFPAELVAPALAQTLASSTSSITLEWKGEDVDNDIKVFEVFFDTMNPPATKVSTTESSSLNVDVNSGNIYYWNIITIDNNGNNSESQIFSFSVD